MPEPDDTRTEALKRLDDELKAFESKRAGSASPTGESESASAAYRLMAGMIGGVLGGLGLGWFFDQLLHSGPFGLIGGLLIGTAASVFTAVRTASRMSTKAAQISEPKAPGADGEV